MCQVLTGRSKGKNRAAYKERFSVLLKGFICTVCFGCIPVGTTLLSASIVIADCAATRRRSSWADLGSPEHPFHARSTEVFRKFKRQNNLLIHKIKVKVCRNACFFVRRQSTPLLLDSKVAASTVAQESSRVELCSARALESSGEAAKLDVALADALTHKRHRASAPHSSRCLAILLSGSVTIDALLEEDSLQVLPQ